MFAFSFSLHALTGHHAYNAEREERGLAAVSLKAYVSGPRFWFESFQNWQSEFLAVWAIVVFSIYLRERGSAQSKAVAAAHSDTGE